MEDVAYAACFANHDTSVKSTRRAGQAVLVLRTSTLFIGKC